MATDGLHALEVIAARRPAVIVSDVMMPGLDGFELLKTVRTLPGPRIAVILVSARAGEEARIEGLEAGADDYVIKPFSTRELIARIANQIEIAKLRDAAESQCAENARLYEEARIARGEAEAASRAKDEFLAILGHELRNPLAPIKVAIQLIKTRSTAPLPREHEIIERQVDHMARLVDDLLDVSRITSGKIELRREVLDAADITMRALEGASGVFARREHQVKTAIERGLLVDGDEMRLSQVIRNLLTNAAKYTPAAGQIEVFARREDGDVVIGVRDNGVGITADMLPHVFDLFAQERQSKARSDGGMGLGLAIVRSLVTLHGGTVELASDGRDCGTLVTMRLPATTRPVTVTPSPLVVSATRDPLRVLIVDDNVDAAVLLAECVRAMGHETAIAFDGAEALRVAATFLPQVALLDIGLPMLDGYEVAAQLNTHASKPLIVAISGYGLEADHLRSRQAGFAAHLVKPVRLDNLSRILAEALAPTPSLLPAVDEDATTWNGGQRRADTA
ncbi:MAG: response regulator [Deltaproteobacteria bacterium]|nr:response regulator [Deltaproteobacteria bacterium]